MRGFFKLPVPAAAIALLLLLLIAIVQCEAKKKFEGDFEFVDEDTRSGGPAPRATLPEKKKWIHDPASELCRPLNCRKRELCLLNDAFTAVCVSKKELHRNRDNVIVKNIGATAAAAGDSDDEDTNDDVMADPERLTGDGAAGSSSSSQSSNSDENNNIDDTNSWYLSPSSYASTSGDKKGGKIGNLAAGDNKSGATGSASDNDGDSGSSNENNGDGDGDDDEDDDDDDDVFYDSDVVEQDEDNCKPCPVVKPTFLCGSDNRTYSSMCRLEYHNCIHATLIRQSCKGFCPCKSRQLVPALAEAQWIGNAKQQQKQQQLQQQQQQRQKAASIAKTYRRTAEPKEANRNEYQSLNSKNSLNSITFTPEDVRVENKHYKYIKYNAYKRDFQTENKHKVHGYNEVLEKVPTKYVKPQQPMQNKCKSRQLTAIGNRLLDWFSVIMADTKQRRTLNSKPGGNLRSLSGNAINTKRNLASAAASAAQQTQYTAFPAACKTEAKWMFGHLDSNSDGLLSPKEMYELEHDANEHCIKPFLDTCDLDRDEYLNTREWCRCFEKTDRPCTAVRRRIGAELLGVYAPDCDVQGFYKPTQCHNSVGVCWCVDKHGVEFANTRTRSKPNCDEVVLNASATSLATADDEDGSRAGDARSDNSSSGNNKKINNKNSKHSDDNGDDDDDGGDDNVDDEDGDGDDSDSHEGSADGNLLAF